MFNRDSWIYQGKDAEVGSGQQEALEEEQRFMDVGKEDVRYG